MKSDDQRFIILMAAFIEYPVYQPSNPLQHFPYYVQQNYALGETLNYMVKKFLKQCTTIWIFPMNANKIKPYV